MKIRRWAVDMVGWWTGGGGGKGRGGDLVGGTIKV